MVAGKRLRLDQALVAGGHFETRERARAAIMAGNVKLNDHPATKAGQPVAETDAITVSGPAHPYASRGGLKLEHALAAFGVDPAGRQAVDAGASTGGFTDVLLQRGATGVVAIDVGYGQLAWALRQDPRVLVMERTNVRYLKPEDLPWAPDLIVADLSFISLGLVMPALAAVLTPGGEAITLIKPQFEAGRDRVSKGVVRDPAIHRDVITAVAASGVRAGWLLIAATPSPIRGPEGNIEFLGHWRPAVGHDGPALDAAGIAAAVAAAHVGATT